jgi:YD repeat-containing protein
MSRSRILRAAPLGAAAALVAGVGLVTLTAGPAQAASGTTVTPAGDSYSASLVSGGSAVFVVGSTTVTCNQSANTGTVPADPANTNAAGPVISTVTAPTFANNGGNCPTNVLFTTAKTVTNSTNGAWTIGLQYDAAGSTGTMTIPQAGVVTTISGLASCTVTVAPNGPAAITGPWVPGTATSLPVLDFSAGVSMPITVTGGLGCPTGATTATFTARYQIADTTDPAQQVTVTEAVAPPTTAPTDTPTTDAPTTDAPTTDPTDTPTAGPTTDSPVA